MKGLLPGSRGAIAALLLWSAASASSAGVAAGALALAAPAAGHHRVALRPCEGRGLDVVVAHEERGLDEAAAEHPTGLHVEAGRVPQTADHVVRCVEAYTQGAPPRALDLASPPAALMTTVHFVPRTMAHEAFTERDSLERVPLGPIRSAVLRI